MKSIKLFLLSTALAAVVNAGIASAGEVPLASGPIKLADEQMDEVTAGALPLLAAGVAIARVTAVYGPKLSKATWNAARIYFAAKDRVDIGPYPGFLKATGIVK